MSNPFPALTGRALEDRLVTPEEIELLKRFLELAEKEAGGAGDWTKADTKEAQRILPQVKALMARVNGSNAILKILEASEGDEDGDP